MMRFGFDPSWQWLWEGGFWWMWIGMAVLRIALIVVAIYLVYRLVRGQPGKKPPQSTTVATASTTLAAAEADGDAALRILRERYAKGEVDTEEYQHRKAELDK